MKMPFSPIRRRLLGFMGMLGISPGGLGLLTTSGVATAMADTGGEASPMVLTAARGRQLLDDALPEPTEVWQFNGSVPGPVIRAKKGKEVDVLFKNGLDQGSAIHWHGIRIDNAMDGVVGMTQASVAPGGEFHYRFVAPDAGTYWYHAHQRSFEQVGRGLYGMMVIEEDEPIDVDQDLVAVLDDWRLDNQGQLQPFTPNMHDISHRGRIGNWITINGEGYARFPVIRGQRIRLRLLNAANSLVMNVLMPDWPMWVMALDGMPITPTMIDGRMLVLGPGHRIDVLLDCPIDEPGQNEISQNEISLMVPGGRIPLGDFQITDDPEISPRGDAPTSFPENSIGLIDEPATNKMELVLSGGAMGSMRHAVHQGETLGIRELVRKGKAWALNGVAGLPEEPLFTAQPGSIWEINIVNDTAWAHGIHLHGHHFEIDHPVFGRCLRDTVLLARGETTRIKLRADNPGKWLLHCHMLEHQMGGMVTWFEVVT